MVDLHLESSDLRDYLKEIPPYITFKTPLVAEKIQEIKKETQEQYIRAKLAFDFVRDEIHHSFDGDGGNVSVGAEDTLKNKEGICFAKSHLLAALLRGMKIPVGFCYQKVLKKSSPDSGYTLHGLNAVYLGHIGWFRVDPRGNKPGVESSFTTIEEKLAYKIRPELGEEDSFFVFKEPLSSVIISMEGSKTIQDLFEGRPSKIPGTNV